MDERVMPYPHLSANNVTLSEVKENIYDVSSGMMNAYTQYWVAEHSGASIDSGAGYVGPIVVMKRAGETAEKAYRSLVEALEAQGWSLV